MKSKYTRFLTILLAVLSVFCLTASALVSCTKKDDTTVRIGALKGPTAMGMAKWMNDSAMGKAKGNYSFELVTTPDALTSSLLSGAVDAAALPVNLAAVLYQKSNGDFRLAAVNTLGVLYILENGDTIHSFEDLRGKKLYATGQGATPEYILRTLLSRNGLDPDQDVEIVYKTEHSELAALMASGDAAIGLLPEPNVTSALAGNSSLRIALDLNEEWDKLGDAGSMVQGCFVVSNAFAEQHPEAYEAMINEYRDSVDYVNQNPEAAEIIANLGILPKKELAARSIPTCHIVLLTGNEAKNILSPFYQILFEQNPASIGGKLPDDGFYKIGNAG